MVDPLPTPGTTPANWGFMLNDAIETRYQENYDAGVATAALVNPPNITDTFTRSDSSTSLGNTDTGETWTQAAGTWGISSNKAYVSTGLASAWSLAMVNSGYADAVIEATFSTVTAVEAGIAFRATDVDNAFYTTASKIYSRTAASTTQIGAFADSLVSGDRMRIVLSGDQISIYRQIAAAGNYILIWTTINSTRNTVTNHGLGLRDTTTTPRFDDFSIVKNQLTVEKTARTAAASFEPLVALASGGASVLANRGRGAVTSGTGETFLATFNIPANTVKVGQQIEITSILQSSSTGTCAPRIRIGTAGTTSDALVNITGTSAAGTSNSFLIVKGLVYVVALGSSSTMAAALSGISTAAAFTNGAASEALGNVPTTAAFFITFSAAASAGTYTVRSIQCKVMP